MTALADQFERARTSNSDIAGHLDALYTLTFDHDAHTVLELGTRGGESTKAWLAGLERTDGALFTVDLIERPPIEAGDVPWVHIQGDDLTPDVIFEAADRTESLVDILFIDTSHEYWRTRAELECYGQLVRPGGHIVLHDTELQPVMQAITEYVEAPGERAEIVKVETHCNGLGILRRTHNPAASSYR